MNTLLRPLAILTVCIAVLTTSLYFLMRTPEMAVDAGGAALSKVVEDFKKYFGFTPTISTKQSVTVHKETPILELSSTSMSFAFSYSLTGKWLGSEKRINLSGEFVGKAGFDLTQNFQIDFDDDLVTVRMPQPKVLSVELRGGYSITGDNGWWNSITDEDRSDATNDFLSGAREWYVNQDALQLAKQRFNEQFETIIKSRLGQQCRIIYK